MCLTAQRVRGMKGRRIKRGHTKPDDSAPQAAKSTREAVTVGPKECSDRAAVWTMMQECAVHELADPPSGSVGPHKAIITTG